MNNTPLESKIKSVIRELPDYPKKGVNFKDITPILADPDLCKEIVDSIVERYRDDPPEAILAIESRGFTFGALLAEHFHIPLVMARKAGKLPPDTISEEFDLEYGSAIVEVHTHAFEPGQKVMIHDDLLATGGTANATAKLVKRLDAKVHSFTFLIELDFLPGRKVLEPYGGDIHSVVHYDS